MKKVNIASISKLFATTALMLFLTSCSTSQVSDDASVDNVLPESEVKIVTTFPPVYSFVANVVGDHAQITNLVPPGASEHTWEPSPSDLRSLSQADLFVEIGLGLEAFSEDMLKASDNQNLKVLTLADSVADFVVDAGELIEFESHDDHAHEEGDHGHDDHDEHDDHDDHGHEKEEKHDDHHDHDHDHHDHDHDHEDHEEKDDDHDHDEHNHDGPDPHIWLVPELAIKQVEAIAMTLSEIDPDHAEEYMANAANYIQSLEKLDADIQARIFEVSPKPFIVFHDAYSYFLKEYGLTAFRKGSIEPFPGREPTAAYFKGLIELIESEGIDIIFTEPQFNPRVAENIQTETGANSFEMDSIGAALNAGEYERMMREMTETFVTSFTSNE